MPASIHLTFGSLGGPWRKLTIEFEKQKEPAEPPSKPSDALVEMGAEGEWRKIKWRALTHSPVLAGMPVRGYPRRGIARTA